ncbi:unnamed protein product [Lampetra planeri]
MVIIIIILSHLLLLFPTRAEFIEMKLKTPDWRREPAQIPPAISPKRSRQASVVKSEDDECARKFSRGENLIEESVARDRRRRMDEGGGGGKEKEDERGGGNEKEEEDATASRRKHHVNRYS